MNLQHALFSSPYLSQRWAARAHRALSSCRRYPNPMETRPAVPILLDRSIASDYRLRLSPKIRQRLQFRNPAGMKNTGWHTHSLASRDRVIHVAIHFNQNFVYSIKSLPAATQLRSRAIQGRSTSFNVIFSRSVEICTIASKSQS
jgi:hypothetical protein